MLLPYALLPCHTQTDRLLERDLLGIFTLLSVVFSQLAFDKLDRICKHTDQ